MIAIEKLKKVTLTDRSDVWLDPEHITRVGRYVCGQDKEMRTRIFIDGKEAFYSERTTDEVMADLAGEGGLASAVARLRVDVERLTAEREVLEEQIAEMKADRANHSLAIVGADGDLSLVDGAVLPPPTAPLTFSLIYKPSLAVMMIFFGIIGAAIGLAAVVG